MSRSYPIRIAALRTGLTTHVVRVWERRYSAIVPSRTPSNRRLYSDEDVHRLTLLKHVTALGHTISMAAKLSNDELQSYLENRQTIPRISQFTGRSKADQFLDSALAAVSRMDEAALESTLGQGSVMLGQQAVLQEVLVPLMEKIGQLWQCGRIRIMHEHLASAVVRRYLGSLLSTNTSENAPRLVATTLTGQVHEFGAMMAAAVATVDGWEAVYLGPNLPANEIAGAVHELKAEAIVLSLIYPADDLRVPEELAKLRKLLPQDFPILAGGRAISAYASVLESIGAHPSTDLESLRTLLTTVRSNVYSRKIHSA